MVPMFMIQLGEIIFGGVGSGLYGMLLLALIAVFVAGLMVGRTPEYLGKKIEAREIKLAMLAVLILPLSILGFTGVAVVLPLALKALANAGPHGFTEILYAYTSADREQRLGLRRPLRQQPTGTPPGIAMCSAASLMSCRCWPSPARWRPSKARAPPPAPCRPTAPCSSAC